MKDKNGVAFILVMCLLLALALGAGGFMGLAGNEIRLVRHQADSTKAFYLAEAGVSKLITEIADLDDEESLADIHIGDPASKSGPKLGDGEYWVEPFPNANPPYAISTGEVNGKERQVKVLLEHSIPTPENAINIFGSPTKHKAKVKIMEHDKKHEGEILVSGLDAGSGPDKLALGVEDADALNKIIDELGKHLKKWGDLEDTLVGDPMNTLTDGEGNEFTASIGEVDSQGFDADFMETVAEQLADNARSMTPTETYDLGGKGKDKEDDFLDPDGDGVVYLGGSKDDVIYITNGKLKLKEEQLSITGKGTLIIDGGEIDIHHADFDWDGDIYILGNEEKGDTKFHVHHADVDINGDIFLLGSDNGKAKLDFHNDDKGEGKEDEEENDGYTKIEGSILAFGGTGDKSKVELKAHHGDLDIKGFITMTGAKSKLDIHQHDKKGGKKEGEWKYNDYSDIRIEGGICLLVPDTEKKEKADIKLHAHGGGEGSFVIQYNSDIIEAAVERLRGKLDLPDRLLKVTSWQEWQEL